MVYRNVSITQALYGTIPLLLGHTATGATTGVYW
jgi:hypothetical protein